MARGGDDMMLDMEELCAGIEYLGTDADPRVDLERAEDAMWESETEKVKSIIMTSDQGSQ